MQKKCQGSRVKIASRGQAFFKNARHDVFGFLKTGNIVVTFEPKIKFQQVFDLASIICEYIM